jgi:hypothetical protein
MLKIDRDLRQTIQGIAERRPEAREKLEQLLAGKLEASDVHELLEDARFDRDERSAIQRVVGQETSRPSMHRPGGVSLTNLQRTEAARRQGQGAWFSRVKAGALPGGFAAEPPQSVTLDDETFSPDDVAGMLGDIGSRGTPTSRLTRKSSKILGDLEDR